MFAFIFFSFLISSKHFVYIYTILIRSERLAVEWGADPNRKGLKSSCEICPNFYFGDFI